MEKLIIFGTGGHAKVVVDLIKENTKYDIIGFISYDKKKFFCGKPVIGSDELFFKELIKKFINYKFFIAIGDNLKRKQLFKKLVAKGFDLINIISKKAHIAKNVNLGKGIVVMNGAVIETDVKIGNGAIINTNSSINHDCDIGDFVHIAPGVNLAGNVKVKTCAFVGIGSCAIPGVVIGKNSIVGAGSVIVENIKEYSLYFGNPAKFIKSLK